eukprot:Gb_21838 [translate_table: standard]
MAAYSTVFLLPLLWITTSLCSGAAGYTDNEDVNVLNTFQLVYWKNTPPSWKGSDPCGSRWDGVLCSSDSKIISLVLSSMNLTGTLESEIGSLSRLESLVLSYNPGLTGQIPGSLGNLRNLKTLILIGCSFNGLIPNELGTLQRLGFLNLEKSLWKQLELSEGAVSIWRMFFDERSYLHIDVRLYPSRTTYFTRSEVLKISLALSNQKYDPSEAFAPCYFIADPLEANYFQDISKSKGLSIGTTIGIVVSTAAVFAIAIFATGIYALRQKRKAIQLGKPFAAWKTSGKDSGGAPQLKGARWFSYNELKEATNNFSNFNEIGSGGYGKVYKGLLAAGGEMVAIKRAKEESLQGAAEFKNEIELLSRVHHKNLVGLIGFCFEEGEQMLVYEYMPNGTLRDNLHRRTGIHLDWGRRLRIALGVPRGLSYLHNHANPPIIHRDVKSSNILLDESLNGKVADFGLSKLVAGGRSYVWTQVKGTLGYLDPEYYMTQQLSEKSDVYSFGVVLMEMIIARQPIERGTYIIREVRNSLEKGGVKGIERELLDPFLRDSSSALTGFQKFVSLAVRCAEESGASRPDMSEVVKELECIVDQSGSSYNREESET